MNPEHREMKSVEVHPVDMSNSVRGILSLPSFASYSLVKSLSRIRLVPSPCQTPVPPRPSSINYWQSLSISFPSVSKRSPWTITVRLTDPSYPPSSQLTSLSPADGPLNDNTSAPDPPPEHNGVYFLKLFQPASRHNNDTRHPRRPLRSLSKLR